MAEVYTNPNEKNDTNEANLERVFSDSMLEQSIAQQIDGLIVTHPDMPLTVIQMDMDKSVEIRKCGISVKIAVLNQVALLLKKYETEQCHIIPHGTRDDITIIRYGVQSIVADEKFVRTVLKDLETTPFAVPQHDEPFHITYSAGIACYPFHGKTAAQLLDLADGANRFAKDHGRNTYAIAESGYMYAQKGTIDRPRMERLFLISHKTGLSVEELIREGYEALFQKHAAFYRFCCQEKED